jgi:hypothetical protein
MKTLTIAMGLTLLPIAAWGQSSPSTGRYAIAPVEQPYVYPGGKTFLAWRINTETGALWLCMHDVPINSPLATQTTDICAPVDGGERR